MSVLDWLVVGTGPTFFLVMMLPFFRNQLRQRGRVLNKSVEQLSDRMHKQLKELSNDPSQTSDHLVTQQILQALCESQSQPGIKESLPLPSGLQSIQPAQESVVSLSKKLAEISTDSKIHNRSNELNLASLAVIYIRSRISEVIKVIEIAQALHVSKSTLYHSLKESLGCSAQDLINVIKMQEAKELLKSGNLLVKEVANRLGFWSPYHFSSRFRVFYGLSPKDFKRHYQNRKKQKSIGSQSEDQHNKCKIKDSQYPTKDIQVHLVENKDIESIQSIAAGTNVGRFVIVSQLGRGGMGEVYKAYDPKLNRGVAIKLIRPERATSIYSQNRLLREAQALARLSHPNVLHVYDVGTFSEQIFIAMALVEGQTLTSWMNAQQRTVGEKLEVMIAAGQGLAAAHKAGLIHRDFKPSNIIVSDDGQVRVLDFGLARAISEPDFEDNTGDDLSTQHSVAHSSGNLLATPLTHAGHVVGTPLYMAPEQYLGLEIDERTDQFGFCIVLYEVLYGKRPFTAGSLKKLKNAVIQEQAAMPSADTDTPTWLWHIVRRGLSTNPSDRYPSIESLLEDLRNDPEKEKSQQRKRQTITITFCFAALYFLYLGYLFFGRPSELCTGADGLVSATWNNNKRENIKQSFAKTGLSYANDSFTRVEKYIVTHLEAWKKEYTAACEATRVTGEQSEKVMDLKTECLRDYLHNVDSLINILGKADNTVVEKSISAVSSLADISICRDVEALRSRIPLPRDEQSKNKIAVIRKKLADLEALVNTGKYHEGLALSRIIEQEAKSVNYKPAHAEALFWLGSLLERSGQYKQAEITLHQSVQLAGKSRDALLAARALTGLVWVVGCQQAKFNEGLSLAREAKVLLDMAGDNDAIRAALQNNLGVISWSRGNYDRALEYFIKTLAIRNKTMGPENPLVAETLHNIGSIFMLKGDNNKALKYYRNALSIKEKSLGSEHPDLAASLNNLGALFQEKGKYDMALRHYTRALEINKKAMRSEHPVMAATHYNIGAVFYLQSEYAKADDQFRMSLMIREKSYGPNHPLVAESLVGIGNSLAHQGRHHEAQAHLERAVRLCEKKPCGAQTQGQGLFGLAKTLETIGGEKHRAVKLAQKALLVFDKNPQVFIEQRKMVHSWLTEHGAKKQ